MASIISGTATAEQLMADLAHDVSNFTQSHGAPPTLAAVLVGDDPASDIYVRRKIEQCRKIGMRSLEHRYGADCTEAELLALIAQLNADPTVHGILVQLPLPKQIDSAKVLDAIDPAKDVDGFHPVNVGRLSTGTGGLVPRSEEHTSELQSPMRISYAGFCLKKKTLIQHKNKQPDISTRHIDKVQEVNT